jgi:hypothetical protein
MLNGGGAEVPRGDGSEATAEVVVRLTREAAMPDSRAAQAVRQAADELGIVLEPLHRGSTDPALSVYVVARVRPAEVSRVVQRLLHCPGVDAAYSKPPGEAP